jgi:hypothetical protein
VNVNGRLNRVEVVLMPPEPPAPAPFRGNSGMRIDPAAFREAIRMLKAAGVVFADDDEEPPSNWES